MSAFDTLMTNHAVPLMFGEMSQAVTYIDPQADNKTVYAIVSPERAETVIDDNGRHRVRRRTFTITTDPDTVTYGGVAEPRESHQITWDSETWTVEHVNPNGSMADLECIRSHVIERTRDNYRNER